MKKFFAVFMILSSLLLPAMPTIDQLKNAEPGVRTLLQSERAALGRGRKTRTDAALAALQLVSKSDTDAAKLLLMKGAFVLFVRDGNVEKAVETLKSIETVIADIPPQSITTMIETALSGIRAEKAAHLRRLLVLKMVRVEGLKASAVVNGVMWCYETFSDDGRICARIIPGEKKHAGELRIPSALHGYAVTRIGNDAFKCWHEIESVIIPSGVTVIGERAFCNCGVMKSVTIPSSVVSIGECAFYKCAGLKTVTIPSSVRKIGSAAFIHCSGLKSVTMCGERPQSGREVFAHCDNLDVVYVPSVLKSWSELESWHGVPLACRME